MSDCLFCKIIDGEIPSKKVFENEYVYAFEDVDPQAPVHVLVVPKEHIPGHDALKPSHMEVLKEIHLAIQEIARDLKLDKGYRVVINQGEEGGQTVNHLHFHLIGGKSLGWPPC